MDSNSVPQDTTNTAVDPAAQLAEANEKIARISHDLDEIQLEQKLTHKLAVAGAVDLETAVLVAKARLDGKTGADLDGCVAQLRKEKAYLFAGPAETAAPRRTTPAKDRMSTSPTALEQAAQKAAQTGSRADLHHYLKLRKNLL
jgi:hypothetical protein